ncbi:MAG TPA: 7-carboxy-7-deazaguanine synthase QueE [bacterium]|nr:7-carboxy-7-deazaguanine synthase QueE [bacterium]
MSDLRQAFSELRRRQVRREREEREAKAPLVEVFHSVQGEGRFVGVPMTFVRVATCPIRCLYCDTPDSYQAPPRARVQIGPRSQAEPNPVRASRAAELVRQAANASAAGSRARVSVTGGEPLSFPEFVHQFGRAVRDHGMRLHLETAALDPDALAVCVNQVDHLSADYKLPETLGEPPRQDLRLLPGADHGDRHLRCIEVALRRGASVDVKIVLTDKVQDVGFERALERLRPLRDKLLLVLQPVTPFGACKRPLPARDLERCVATAMRHEFDLRVVPQTHKTLNLP